VNQQWEPPDGWVSDSADVYKLQKLKRSCLITQFFMFSLPFSPILSTSTVGARTGNGCATHTHDHANCIGQFLPPERHIHGMEQQVQLAAHSSLLPGAERGYGTSIPSIMMASSLQIDLYLISPYRQYKPMALFDFTFANNKLETNLADKSQRFWSFLK